MTKINMLKPKWIGFFRTYTKKIVGKTITLKPGTYFFNTSNYAALISLLHNEFEFSNGKKK